MLNKPPNISETHALNSMPTRAIDIPTHLLRDAETITSQSLEPKTIQPELSSKTASQRPSA